MPGKSIGGNTAEDELSVARVRGSYKTSSWRGVIVRTSKGPWNTDPGASGEQGQKQEKQNLAITVCQPRADGGLDQKCSCRAVRSSPVDFEIQGNKICQSV